MSQESAMPDEIEIRAAVCRVHGEPLSMETVLLRGPGPGEVRVDVSAVAICHSDILYMDGGWGGELPAVFGHEAAGIVAEVGDGVNGVAVGDNVVVTLIRSCGECRACVGGNPATCQVSFPLDDVSPLRTSDGTRIGHGLRTAAFAEQVVVHQSQLAVVSERLGAVAGSLLACGVITGYGAVTNTADVHEGDAVVIIGAGGVGLNVIQGARAAGANPIIVSDPATSKHAFAQELGATNTVDPSAESLADRVAEITGGAMADHVFVAVGSARAIDGSAELLARNGSLVLVGIPASGVTTTIDPVTLASSNQRILGSKMGGARVDHDVPHLAGEYLAGRLELDGLVSGTFPLEAINEAVDEVRRGGVNRNVIVFD